VIALEAVSPIGFGTYRARETNAEHRQALELAFQSGINLVDTASSYGNGSSERLIGQVLRRAAPDSAFVITKAAYLTPSSMEHLTRNGIEHDESDGGRRSNGTAYSLAPDVLTTLVHLSKSRLGVGRLDAVLLHNPELARVPSSVKWRGKLSLAFETLSSLVDAGECRFFGVSSNVLAGADGVSFLHEVIDAAPSGTVGRTFKFLQFPTNLLEQHASPIDPIGSLVAEAHDLSLLCIGNRPLNAIVEGRAVRLTERPSMPPDVQQSMQRFINEVSAQLVHLNVSEAWDEFAPMQFLRDASDQVVDVELLDAVWATQFEPFFDMLFGPQPMEAAVLSFSELHDALACQALRAQADVPSSMMKTWNERPQGSDDGTTIAMRAVADVLDSGVDHVLVGMRRPSYVAQMSRLIRLRAE
jgi:aryl-alcohol dehydrogenase-like predicted oxidoreductase